MDLKPNLKKSIEQKELEKKIEQLEKRVATLEGQVQRQPKSTITSDKDSLTTCVSKGKNSSKVVITSDMLEVKVSP